MLNVLLESKPRSTRRIGGTVTSALVHGALLAGAVILTLPPRDGGATIAPPKPREIFYVPIQRQPEPAETATPIDRSTQPRTMSRPDLPVISLVVPDLPRTEPRVFTDDIGFHPSGGVPADGVAGPNIGNSGPNGGVVEERLVDRSPRLLGTPAQPTFPASLRQSGRAGRVLVQFVVDTTGRAEMSGFKVMETSDPLFAESVRDVLPRYRFSPGEAGGRKVRTLVQLPFDFTLVR